jgi:hypothetical protein
MENKLGYDLHYPDCEFFTKGPLLLGGLTVPIWLMDSDVSPTILQVSSKGELTWLKTLAKPCLLLFETPQILTGCY